MIRICLNGYDPNIKGGWNWANPSSIEGIAFKTAWGINTEIGTGFDLSTLDKDKPSLGIVMNEFICFYINNIPRLLDPNYFIKVYMILGAQTRVGIDLNTVPEYLRDEESIEDILNCVIEEFKECFSSDEEVAAILDSIEVKDLEELKSFPKKKIDKEELYLYTNSEWYQGLNNLLEKINPDFDYFLNEDYYYKANIDGIDYFLHIYHLQNGNNIYKVYFYDKENQTRGLMKDDKAIFQIIIYNIWKTL